MPLILHTMKRKSRNRNDAAFLTSNLQTRYGISFPKPIENEGPKKSCLSPIGRKNPV